jgi:hypothetical protein
MLLGKLLEEVYTACGLLALRRVATGGSTTTVVDTGMINRKADGYYAQGASGGHILIVSTTTDGLAPQGQFGEISTYTLTTATPTFTVPTMTAGVGAGDVYAVCKPVIQLQEMIGRINEGLRRLQETEASDFSLTTLSDTRVYDLPSGVRPDNILGIEIGNDTDGYEDAPGYDLIPSQGSGTSTLIFTALPPTDSTTPTNKTIKIRYHAVHPTLALYSDTVEKSVSDELAIAVCAEAAYELLMAKKPAYFVDKSKFGLFQFIQARAAAARAERPIRTKPATRQSRINLSEM